jgi:hypothetical protein
MRQKTMRNRLMEFIKTAAAVAGFLWLLLATARSQNALTAGGGSASGSNGGMAFAVGQSVGGGAYAATFSLTQGVIQPHGRTVVVRQPPVVPSQFRVYPNPASDAVFIDADHAGPFSLAVYDLDGKTVLPPSDGTFNPPHPVRLDVAGLANGVYLLNLQTPTARAVYKILVAD